MGDGGKSVIGGEKIKNTKVISWKQEILDTTNLTFTLY